MKQVEIEDISGTWPGLLAEVEQGEILLIVRDGKPVARITREDAATEPEGPFATEDVIARRTHAIDSLLAFREKHPLNGVTIRELIDEGRKY